MWGRRLVAFQSRFTVLTMVTAVLVPLASVVARADGGGLVPRDRDPVVAGHALDVKQRKENPPAPEPVVTWPSAGVGVTAAAAAADGGAARVRLDYSGFAEAYGGAFGARLRLTRLPACALSTPDKPDCVRGTPVAGTNDTRAKTLSAEVETAGAVFAATAAPASAKGDYQATKLAPSATWQVSTQTGDFGWTYPLHVPPVPGGLTPNLNVNYSSGSIDGRASNTNNQGSWVADGFDLWSAFIERKYKSCKDDGVAKDPTFNVYPGDQCWGYDNAAIQLGGNGGELVPAGGNLWKLRNDDGTRVEHLTGSETDTHNGDNDNEYWRVTTPDGTRYFFGKNRLPGWAAGKDETNSTWAVPVFGDDGGEPCHKDTFADSWCQQAWRWNLDYVEDTDGNALVYYYTKEDNRYARNLKSTNDTPYTRSGYIARVEYGLRTGNLFPARAPARVDFEVSERCLRAAADCAVDKIDDHPEYWEDVPFDLNCKSGQECNDFHGTASPTYWSRKRLTKVTTKVLNPAGTGYRNVTSWAFDHDWGTADADRQLLLKSITQTGEAASPAITLPPVSFVYTQLPNRVDRLGDDVGPFIKNRLGTVYNETGGQLDVNYSGPDCTTATVPSPQANHSRCFPIFWTRTSGDENPTLDWFHKYVVTQLVQTDLTGGSPDQVTNYDYSIGRPAWHYDDDDGLVPEKYKTWSQWRGYDKVRVIGGATSDNPSQTDYWYFQGMDADRLDRDGGSKNVTVADGEGATYEDHQSLRGMTVRTVSYDRAGGAVVSKVVGTPRHLQTAAKVRAWGTVTADQAATSGTRSLTSVDGGWRETRTTTTSFEPVTGAPKQVESAGDTAVSGDERCGTTTFTAAGTRIVPQPAQVRTVARLCSATADLSRDLISDERVYYDGAALGAAPTLGRTTLVEKAKSATATAVTYLAAARTEYDGFGRATKVTDVAGGAATTAYTETNGLTTRVSVTSPPAVAGTPGSALTTSMDLDPASGNPTSDTDAGGKTLTVSYDALGRVRKVWSPGRAGAAVPDSEFDYLVRPNAVVSVITKDITAAGGQDTAYTLLDGWLRTRQTQTFALRDATTSGRLVSDTFYNAAGSVDRTYAPYFADGTPNGDLFGVANPGQIETQHAFSYDGLGRTTADRLLVGGGDTGERWRTTYQYGGNWTKVVPPAGGTPTTSYVDALGRTTETREHRANGYLATSFGYDNRGLLETVTGPGGHTWRSTYDLRGRKIAQSDPDTGIVRYTYNDLDQLTQTEDARGTKLDHGYDGTGRRITTSSAGTVLARWTYDTVRKGQLTSSTRYVGADAYTITVDFYDNLNRPTRTRIVLPASEGVAQAPAGGYTFDTSYNLDGSVRAASSPAAGDLPAETMTYTYDTLGRPVSSASNLSTYVIGTDYTKTGTLIGQHRSTGARQLDEVFEHEPGTERLTRSTSVHSGTPGTDRSAEYRYTDAGQLTRITDTSRDGVDNQCFRYDDLNRLTDAWTETAGCSANPSTAPLGGPAPYRVGYTYDDTGNRTSETNQSGATRGYSYAGSLGADPAQYKGHQLAGVTGAESYGYDAGGNTVERRTAAGNQTLSWDVEGELAAVADSAKGETRFVYTATGDRLIRRDPTGTTLYLPDMEVRQARGATTATATRYYQAGAVRTAAGVTFFVDDHHGTSELAINAADGSVSQRRYTPFGQLRATRSAWPVGVEKGFVGGTTDAATDLTTLGARGYDPNTGRFISVDPLIEFGDSQQINGYAYASNNPVTLADPSGLFPGCWGWECTDGGGTSVGHDTSPIHNNPPPSQSHAPVRKKSCHWYTCGVKDAFNGTVDGAANYVLSPAKNLGAQMLGAGCVAGGGMAGQACASGAAEKRDEILNEDIHIPLGGDPNSKTYKVFKIVGEYGSLIVGGASGGVRATLKLSMRIAAKKAAAKAARQEAESAAAKGARKAAGGVQGEPNVGLGRLIKVNANDPDAEALAQRIGGQSSMRFSNDPTGREFDAVSDVYIGQAKPANFKVNKEFRDQSKATFIAARRTGRVPYYHFNGRPHRDVLRALDRYADRYQIYPVIEWVPFGG